MTTDPVPGIDAPAVTRWLRERLPVLSGTPTFRRIGDGRSNLTYAVDDGDGVRCIVRRPPLGPRLASAHDMSREYRLIAALGPTAVPVPHAIGLCEDDTVTGAPFYAMEYVDGRVVASAQDAAELVPAARRAAGIATADTLARLHALDVDAVGLGDLARRDAYAERQLRRWAHQWEQSRTREIPAIDRTHQLLTAATPAQQDVAIVHGDYKLENLVISDEGEVRAVLDWELCTLGDPLADLGLLLVYWSQLDDRYAIGTATTVPGSLARAELVSRYAEVSGRDLSALPFYRALGAWKLAIILQGVVRRFRETAGNANVDPATFDPIIDALAEQALETAEGLPR